MLVAIAVIAAFVVGAGDPAETDAAALPPAGPSAACDRGGAAAASPRSLVVALHGYSSSPELLLAESGLDRAARAAGAVLVAPQASGSPARWATPGGLSAGGDAGDVATAIHDAGERDCVDLSRITFVGYSNGALMATWLACRWPDRVAAVVLVGGAGLGPACDAASLPAVPTVLVHGHDDPVVPYDGGPVLGGRLDATAFREAAARWPAARVLTVSGAGHRWPGPDVAGIDLAALAVALAAPRT